MRPEASQTSTPLPGIDQGDSSAVWSIITHGLKPLALLMGISFAVLILIMLTRILIDPARFFLVQQLIFAIVFIAWLALAVITSLRAIQHALRRIEMWRQNGQPTKVTAELVALTILALAFVLPVILLLIFYE